MYFLHYHESRTGLVSFYLQYKNNDTIYIVKVRNVGGFNNLFVYYLYWYMYVNKITDKDMMIRKSQTFAI